jgi:hypothetical protein
MPSSAPPTLTLEGLDQHKCWAKFEHESFGEAGVSGAERVSQLPRAIGFLLGKN